MRFDLKQCKRIMTVTKLKIEAPKSVGSLPQHSGRNRENADDFAAYAFDMLQSLREASTREKHAFLRYLMGLAAEEAIRLAEGQSSAAAAYSVHKST